MPISDAEFYYIRDLVYKAAAIVLEDGKAYLVESRLQPVARRHGYASLNEMIAHLRRQPPNGMQWQIVEAMTTNETYFFRDVHPFEMLKKSLLPELIDRRSDQRQLNIWCAAASSGQEAYTVAMVLREYFPELATWKINFIASDVSEEMLARCREGCYSQLEVSRGLPALLLVKYFQKIGVEWQIHDELRRMVDFRQINLAQPWPALPPMDIIFIRNVMIYFDLPTKKDIMARLSKLLRRDGCLVLGAAETTLNIDDSYKRVQVEEGTYYKLRAA
jgi:chemotaxis protein methyltransferase CheR